MRRPLLLGVLVALALAAAALLAVLARGSFSLAAELDAPIEASDPGALATAGERSPAVGAAEALSGTADDRRLREGLALVLAAEEPGLEPATVLELHSRAIVLLTPIARADGDPNQSRAANVVGLVYLEDSGLEEESSARAVQQAGEAFAQAVRADAANADAKYNLELVLDLQRATAGMPGDVQPGGGGVTGAGERPPGSGY